MLRKRYDDLPVLLESPAGAHDGDADEAAVGCVSEMVAFGRRVNIDGALWVADVKVEHVVVAS